MNEFEKQYQEILDFLKFEDYPLAVKRIIDFTLDTQEISFYTKTCNLLNWLDNNPDDNSKKEKLQELLAELHSALVKRPQQIRQNILEASELTKKYSGFTLGPVNLSLNEGDIIGLVGENGNGKTTLLRSLCGELYPTSGHISYNFKHEDLYDLRTKLVYIPQRTDTWYGSMMDNLLFTATSYGFSPQESPLVVELVVARLGLRKFRQHKWKDLSSGYKMRFELARMLLRKPKVLLIDEPLANLDILAQQTVLEDFRAIAKSAFRPIGIILSSQQLYEVEKASDEVIFLKQGIQKNLKENNEANNTEKHLVIEFECPWSQSELNDHMLNGGLVSLQFNGGTYIATFNGNVTINHFMKLIIDHNIPVVYMRDISNSTRRFFVS